MYFIKSKPAVLQVADTFGFFPVILTGPVTKLLITGGLEHRPPVDITVI